MKTRAFHTNNNRYAITQFLMLYIKRHNHSKVSVLMLRQAKHVRVSYNASNDCAQLTMPATTTSAAPPTPPMSDQDCSFTYNASIIWNFIYGG